MELKHFIKIIAKQKGYSIERLSEALGRQKSSLGRTLNNGSLSVKDLQAIMQLLGSNLEIIYNEKTQIITIKN